MQETSCLIQPFLQPVGIKTAKKESSSLTAKSRMAAIDFFLTMFSFSNSLSSLYLSFFLFTTLVSTLLETSASLLGTSALLVVTRTLLETLWSLSPGSRRAPSLVHSTSHGLSPGQAKS